MRSKDVAGKMYGQNGEDDLAENDDRSSSF